MSTNNQHAQEKMKFGDVDAVGFSSASYPPQPGKYLVGGVKVLGPQQAAVIHATGTGDIVARFNDLLTKLENHGIIATV